MRNPTAQPLKKTLTPLLAVGLTVSLCPLAPVAQAQAEETGNADAQLTSAIAPQSSEPLVNWTQSGTARWMIDAQGALTIAPLEGQTEGELEGWQFYPPWFDYTSSITSAKVTGKIVLNSANNLFLNCWSLKTADLAGLDTSKATHMGNMFLYCSSLTSLNLSSFDTSNATSMTCMFQGCTSLQSLDISGFDTSKVEDMSNMFYGCSQLTSLDVSGFNTPKVYHMGRMFQDCSKLTSLDVSGFNTSNVTDAYNMFDGCSSLKSLDLSNFDTKRFTSTWEMFKGCSSLTSLDLSNFDTSMAYTMTDMFTGCDSLDEVTLGAKFSFTGSGSSRLCDLPSTKDANRTGLWVSSADGKKYAASAVPSNVAATYTAQRVARAFADVDYAEWYGDAVTFVSEKGLITGYSDSGLFGVGDTLTRGQLATILWRNARPDEAASYDPAAAKDATGLAGTADGEYYTAAVNWAVKNGVITGFDRADGSKDFAAGDPVTFEQLITILSRIGAEPGEVAAAGTDLSGFADGGAADEWAAGAIAWAAGKGLVTGYVETDGKYLRPAEDVARERVAVVLMRAFEMGILK